VSWLGEHLWAVWIVLAAVLAMTEMVSLDLVLLMLAVGAVVGALAALASFPVVLQVLLAGGGAAAMLSLVRPNLLRHLHGGPDLVTGMGKLVGQQGLVTEELSAHHPGRVKVGGEIWSAQPYDESLIIAPGQTVEVFAIRGATAFVHPIGEMMP
jgi:membrane protein implicated in regulation of membrane protease activity